MREMRILLNYSHYFEIFFLLVFCFEVFNWMVSVSSWSWIVWLSFSFSFLIYRIDMKLSQLWHSHFTKFSGISRKNCRTASLVLLTRNIIGMSITINKKKQKREIRTIANRCVLLDYIPSQLNWQYRPVLSCKELWNSLKRLFSTKYMLGSSGNILDSSRLVIWKAQLITCWMASLRKYCYLFKELNVIEMLID